jgi:hypothetical protein
MYVNLKKIPVETIPGIEEWRDKREWSRGNLIYFENLCKSYQTQQKREKRWLN